MALAVSLISITTVLAVTACGSTQSQLIGKWKEKGGTEVLEFFKDGRVSITDKGQSLAGSWTVLDDGRVKLEVSFLGTAQILTGALKGGILRLEMGNRAASYERAS
jgi:hypothetical protein